MASFTIELDGAGEIVEPLPTAPEVTFVPWADGTGKVTVRYKYTLDPTAYRGDDIKIWLTSTGNNPSRLTAHTYLEAMIFSDGMAKVEWITDEYANGTTLKIDVAVGRNADGDAGAALSAFVEYHTIVTATGSPGVGVDHVWSGTI